MPTLSTANTHSPAANTDAVLTYTGVAGTTHVFLNGVSWSYDNDPTGGRIWITVDGSTVFDMDITGGGAGFIPFHEPLYATPGKTVIFRLEAGGSGVTGKLSVLGHRAVS
jgi:hypothetical protein